MSDSLNSVTLSGNLGQDAEVRYTSSGLAITSFSLAVSKSRKQSDGSYKDSTSWVDCVMYGKRGEAMYGNGMLQKGARLAIVGRLHQNVWEKDGQRRSKLEVIVDELEFMSSRNGNNANQGYDNSMTAGYAPQPAPMAAPVAAPIVDASASVYDEDIPF